MVARIGYRRALLVAVYTAAIFLIGHIFGMTGELSIWPGASSKTQEKDQSNLTADEKFRRRLRTVRPTDTRRHSKSLGVADGLYMISLARRKDRREKMDTIARALDIEFRYIDATDARSAEDEAMINRVIDRVRWQRARVDEREAVESDWPQADNTSNAHFTYYAFPFQWSQEAQEHHERPLSLPIIPSGADYWAMNPVDNEWEASHPMPKLTDEDKKRPENLVHFASVENNLWLPETVGRVDVACWDSHVKAIREMIGRKDGVGIIFEDDIDIEWDVESILMREWPALPEDWDIVYLGHCFSKEYEGEPVDGASRLRLTQHALCLHAYALSQRGAAKVYRHLRSPDFAYSRPIDHAVKDLVLMQKIKSVSVYPPVVIQSKVDASDISGIVGYAFEKNQRDTLFDSTLERIALLKKEHSDLL